MERTWKIIKIIDSYRVVVNAGSNDQINEGQALDVYVPGQEVTDPETGENLGALDFIKAKLCAVDVFPKMTICENRVSERGIGLAQALSPWFDGPMPLDVNAKEISGGFEGLSREIRLGDLVRPTV